MFQKIFEFFKKHFAFSMVEITISLITISLIAAAFAPVITKKVKDSSLVVRESNEAVSDCSEHKPSICSDKLSKDCELCFPDQCVLCNKVCKPNQYKQIKCCTCKNCSERPGDGPSAGVSACNKCGDTELGAKNCDGCQKGYYLCKCADCDYKCKRCPEGHKCEDGSICPTPCKEDQWSDAGQWECNKKCPKGTYCHTITQVFAECNKNTSCNNKHIQEPCPAGYYCVEGRKRQLCPAGSYQDVPQPANMSQRTDKCKCCAAGYWSCAAGKSATDPACIGRVPACTDKCQAGYYCNNCTKTICPVGHKCPEGSSSPTPCPKGTYQDLTGQASCKSCPAGKHQNSTGQTSCSNCAAGSYSTGGAHTCALCGAGWYQPNVGQSGCGACAPGWYQPSAGQAWCAACPAGTYQPHWGQTGCAGCPGCHTSSAGASGCSRLACCAGWTPFSNICVIHHGTDGCPAGFHASWNEWSKGGNPWGWDIKGWLVHANAVLGHHIKLENEKDGMHQCVKYGGGWGYTWTWSCNSYHKYCWKPQYQ